MQDVCVDKSKLKLNKNKSDKILIRSFNNSRFGGFFKFGMNANPDGKNDILVGLQYRNIFKPFTNHKSVSVDAKFLYNFTGKVMTNPDDNLMMTIYMIRFIVGGMLVIKTNFGETI